MTGVHRLNAKETIWWITIFRVVEDHLVNHAFGNNDVILLVELKCAHASVQDAGTEMKARLKEILQQNKLY